MAGLADALRRHRRVGLDTVVFIYHLEASSEAATVAATAISALAEGTFQGITSVLTLMEVAVRPLQLHHPEVADEYEILLATFPHLVVADVDRRTARRAAELRAKYRLRPADAVHIATSLHHGATAFLTNDRALRRVTELDVLVLADYVES